MKSTKGKAKTVEEGTPKGPVSRKKRSPQGKVKGVKAVSHGGVEKQKDPDKDKGKDVEDRMEVDVVPRSKAKGMTPSKQKTTARKEGKEKVHEAHPKQGRNKEHQSPHDESEEEEEKEVETVKRKLAPQEQFMADCTMMFENQWDIEEGLAGPTTQLAELIIIREEGASLLMFLDSRVWNLLVKAINRGLLYCPWRYPK